jgi:putative transposase
MKRSRFTKRQIIGVLERFHAGASVAELCDEYGISASTLYAWRSRYIHIKPEEDSALHRMRRENRRLRRIIAGMTEETDRLKGMIRASQFKIAQPPNEGITHEDRTGSGESDAF